MYAWEGRMVTENRIFENENMLTLALELLISNITEMDASRNALINNNFLPRPCHGEEVLRPYHAIPNFNLTAIISA